MIKYQLSERLNFHSELKQPEVQKDFITFSPHDSSSLTGIKTSFRKVVISVSK
jgi:hypothetical protein